MLWRALAGITTQLRSSERAMQAACILEFKVMFSSVFGTGLFHEKVFCFFVGCTSGHGS